MAPRATSLTGQGAEQPGTNAPELRGNAKAMRPASQAVREVS